MHVQYISRRLNSSSNSQHNPVCSVKQNVAQHDKTKSHSNKLTFQCHFVSSHTSSNMKYNSALGPSLLCCCCVEFSLCSFVQHRAPRIDRSVTHLKEGDRDGWRDLLEFPPDSAACWLNPNVKALSQNDNPVPEFPE